MRRWLIVGVSLLVAGVVAPGLASASGPTDTGTSSRNTAASEPAFRAVILDRDHSAKGVGGTAEAATVALSATRVTGWPRSLRSAAPGSRLAVPVRVASRGGAVGRVVVVQRYRPATLTWTPVVRARTGVTGRVALQWTAPTATGSYAYRLRVLPTARASGVLTASSALRVTRAIPVPLQLVRAVNAARAVGRTCGSKSYRAVPPVMANAALARAAGHFATRMGTERFFAHVSPSGDGPGERITAAGYRWRTYGEDIAAGYRTVPAVMAGWLASPGHCAIIMGSGFGEIGAGHADVPGSPYGTYWVLDLAHH